MQRKKVFPLNETLGNYSQFNGLALGKILDMITGYTGQLTHLKNVDVTDNSVRRACFKDGKK